MAIKFHWVLITYAKYQDAPYKENKTTPSISGCTYQGFFSYHKREKFLVHDNELIHDRAHRASTVSTAYKSLVHCTSIPNIPSPKKPFKVKEHVTSTQAA